ARKPSSPRVSCTAVVQRLAARACFRASPAVHLRQLKARVLPTLLPRSATLVAGGRRPTPAPGESATKTSSDTRSVTGLGRDREWTKRSYLRANRASESAADERDASPVVEAVDVAYNGTTLREHAAGNIT